MDWKTYEEITKYIYETLGKDISVKIIGHGSLFKVKGKSGVEHQIDVLTSHSDGIHDYFTGIECKYWNKKVNKDIIMKVDEIVKDCNFNKGIIVSKVGFTPDAEKYANFVNIGLVILREPIEEDWDGRLKTIVLEIHNYVPHITKFENKVIEAYKDFSGPINTDRYFYIFNDGNKKTIKDYLTDFQIKLQKENRLEEIIEEIDFDTPILFQDISGTNISKVTGIKMTGRVDVTTITNIVDAEDEIWLMMKSIFEGKTYAISNDGKIWDI